MKVSSMKNPVMRKRPRLSLIAIALLAGVACSQYSPAEAQAASGCTLSDLNIDANTEGYTRLPTECPKVAYKRNLSRNHARGFYIVETPHPYYHSSDEWTPADAVNQYTVLVQSRFGAAYKGRIYETANFPPWVLEHGGACRGLVVRLSLSHRGREGVEWRRGIICLVESPPAGSKKWILIQAFFFDMNLKRANYEPSEDFEQAARELFRSIRVRELKE
jgi:hypothetical protein